MAETKRECPEGYCRAELKPLFQSFYCPREDEHQALKAAQEAETKRQLGSDCNHPVYTMYSPGVTTCLVCGVSWTSSGAYFRQLKFNVP